MCSVEFDVTLVPAFNDATNTDGGLECLVAVTRRVELGAVSELV